MGEPLNVSSHTFRAKHRIYTHYARHYDALTSHSLHDSIGKHYCIFMARLAPWLPTLQITISVLFVVSVLLQNRGAAVGATFGGSGTIYRTKRGVEKMLFQATIILAVIFAATSLVRIIIP